MARPRDYEQHKHFQEDQKHDEDDPNSGRLNRSINDENLKKLIPEASPLAR